MSNYQYREIITPLRNLPFSLLNDKRNNLKKLNRKKAVFILFLAGFSIRKLTHLFRISHNTVTIYISEGCELYPDVKKGGIRPILYRVGAIKTEIRQPGRESRPLKSDGRNHCLAR